jgi:hypothetical protein
MRTDTPAPADDETAELTEEERASAAARAVEQVALTLARR